jgi:hypothetical protein
VQVHHYFVMLKKNKLVQGKGQLDCQKLKESLRKLNYYDLLVLELIIKQLY